jgi:alcohol dehydrogenase (cytochrome c)
MILRHLTISVPFVLTGLVALAYQAPPATRPTPTYAAKCATCHGDKMTGGTGPTILQYVRYHTDKEVTAVLQGAAHRSATLTPEELKNVLGDIRVLAGTNPAMATGGYTGSRGPSNPPPGARGGGRGRGPATTPPRAAPARAGALSEAEGKALLTRMCSMCHSVEAATAPRETLQGWTQIVRDMVSLGAQGSEEEIQQVIRYLAEHFSEPPRANAAPPPSAALARPPATSAMSGQPGRGRANANVARGPEEITLADGRSIRGLVMAQSDVDATVLAGNTFHLLARDGNTYHEKALVPKADWLSYDGSPAGNRYSALDQINTSTVQRLAPAWMFAMTNSPRLEVTPVVVDGIMYVTGWNEIFALDATTGRQLWTYNEPRHDGILGEAGAGANRGAAIGGDRVFMITDHAHLLAFNRFTGAKLWNTNMASHLDGYSASAAPIVIGDLVLSGVAGGEEGARGFIDAYHVATGQRAWRFYTIPARGEPGSETWIGQAIDHGCGATWLTGSFDGELDLTYWGIGNPCPDYTGDERKGDNLYTASVVALSSKTGKLVWYYQFTPHDTHDWDSTQPMVLVDEVWAGTPRKLLLHGDRNGVFYVLDRATGQVLLTSNLSTKVTWHQGFTKDGKPIVDPGSISTREGVAVCPGAGGGGNWPAAAYSPQTKLFYTRVLDSCGVYTSHQDPLGARGDRWFGGGTASEKARRDLEVLRGGMPTQSYIRAFDPFTGKKVWEFAHQHSRNGVMATAGGLVFLAAEGGFVALDAKNGQPVWNMNLGQIASASPMSYMVGGKQYITQAGTGVIVTYALK